MFSRTLDLSPDQSRAGLGTIGRPVGCKCDTLSITTPGDVRVGLPGPAQVSYRETHRCSRWPHETLHMAPITRDGIPRSRPCSANKSQPCIHPFRRKERHDFIGNSRTSSSLHVPDSSPNIHARRHDRTASCYIVWQGFRKQCYAQRRTPHGCRVSGGRLLTHASG